MKHKYADFCRQRYALCPFVTEFVANQYHRHFLFYIPFIVRGWSSLTFNGLTKYDNEDPWLLLAFLTLRYVHIPRVTHDYYDLKSIIYYGEEYVEVNKSQ